MYKRQIEICVRILATGLVRGRGSFLRDRWHWLDVVVVVTSCVACGARERAGGRAGGTALGAVWCASVICVRVSLFNSPDPRAARAPRRLVSVIYNDSTTSYGALRTFRVLRPLRTVTRVRGMRVLVISMIRSIPKLIDVAVVAGFVGLVFAVIGVQLFKGALHSRCVPAHDPVLRAGLPRAQASALGDSPYDHDVCTERDSAACNARYGGSGGDELECVYFDTNPNYDLTSFDDLPHALLVIFVSVTLEGWSDVMCARRASAAARRPPQAVQSAARTRRAAVVPAGRARTCAS